MKLGKQGIATVGLIFITFLAAIQYIFLQYVPDSISNFAFVCITNVIGVVLLFVFQIKKLTKIKRVTLQKGILFALELTGFNFFTLIGSQHMDPVIISSVISLYFVFITPLLLLLRKRINFFSSIATVIAIIALLLMFGADTDALFSSVDVIYLIIADIFFAAYVVSVSVFGENEDTIQLTFSQMVFSAVFGLIGWVVEAGISGQSLSLPTQKEFWISAIFIGIFIRVIYGLIQISSQKYVSALKASLIFAAEILITLITNPIMCRLFGIEYTPMTIFQIIGGILFIIATLMVDEGIMAKLGYEDVSDNRASVSKKIVLTTLTFSLITLILSTAICLGSIQFIRNSAVDNSQKLGVNASEESSGALVKQLEVNISNQAVDKTVLAEEKLEAYSNSVTSAASYAHYLYEHAETFPAREVEPPKKENGGKWVMQRNIANPGITYEELQEESGLLGNMETIFKSMIEKNKNVSTVYVGTKSGLLVSYDPNSDSAATIGEGYYEYRYSVWFRRGRECDSYVFTEPYQDGYGRGLTITCVAPFKDAYGHFAGCIAMDILMSELNDTMVNDGIVDPAVATLIDQYGHFIAGRDVDPNAKNPGSIFDNKSHSPLKEVGHEIIEQKDGVVSTGTGDDANYIAFSTIDSTGWILCILNPVSSVIKPAQAIRASIDENTNNVVTTVVRGVLTVIQSCLVLSALILIFVTLFTGKVSNRISAPLKKLEEDVRQISEGNLDRRTEVTSDDEIGSLAGSFNHMTDSLQKYIADLKEVTAKEERIASELSVATNIQASMLPTNFDTFTDHSEFKIFAAMTPAKEVGGDFYDFFLVDDDHLAVVMADVSGKGVPAALFMVIAKTLIKNRAQLGGTPGQVLTYANEQLCEGNDAQLFVTVWLAIIEISTGKGIAANAGHEHPALRRAGGKWELVKYRHSPAVATMDGLVFKEHEFELNPGDCLYVYTDGVTEATTADDELFGEERLIEALNKQTGEDPRTLLQSVKEDIDTFVGDAPQFDDITMLALSWIGKN